ncbi:hypothetical protein Ancab_031240 [Ancistrocladus abbreviatus]
MLGGKDGKRFGQKEEDLCKNPSYNNVPRQVANDFSVITGERNGTPSSSPGPSYPLQSSLSPVLQTRYTSSLRFFPPPLQLLLHHSYLPLFFMIFLKSISHSRVWKRNYRS